MLSENKFYKYLIYALGEIILVVIGILIALNINNWNEEQKKATKRHELLIGMTKELAQDIAAHDYMIGFYQARLNFFERQLQTDDFSNTPLDTLFRLFDSIAGAHSVSDQSFQKAKSLGIGQLCTDDSLSMRINLYYTRHAEVTKMLFEYDFDLAEKQNHFWMNDQELLEFDFNSSLQIPVLQDSAERREKALTMIMSPVGRNNIKTECMVKEIMLSHNLRMRESTQTLLTDLEAYIENAKED